MWKVKKSPIHGYGVVATEEINKGTKIIEYKGEKNYKKKEGDRRSELRIKRYSKKSDKGIVYIFELNKKYDIDGTPHYNKARYINHSCEPNCEVEIEKGKIWISSIKKLKRVMSYHMIMVMILIKMIIKITFVNVVKKMYWLYHFIG